MIYFDNSATTPPSSTCVKAMTDCLEFESELWANPSSHHAVGAKAHSIVEKSRENILVSMGVRDGKRENLIFTASGSEADNLAILGTARAKKILAGKKAITTDTEHPAVLNSFSELEKEGFCTGYVRTKGGKFDMEQFRGEMTPDTFLVSVMLVNNETGAINPVKEIAGIAHGINPDCIVHVDAVQGFLHVPFSPTALGADMIAVSAHKIHGPKGIGALYVSPACVKRRTLSPVIFGGGQEGGLRSGTENTPAIAGFAAAAVEGSRTQKEDSARMAELRDYLTEEIGKIPGCGTHVPQSQERAPHIVSMYLPGIRSETALNFFSHEGVCVSAGSACAAGSGRISRTLLQYGIPEKEADSTLRISLSRYNTKEECDVFLTLLRKAAGTLVRK